MQGFENLAVWQAARRFTKSTCELTIEYPRSEECGLNACALEWELIVSFGLACIAEVATEEALASLSEAQRMLTGLIDSVVGCRSALRCRPTHPARETDHRQPSRCPRDETES